MLLGWKFISQNGSIMNRLNSNFALILGMDVRHIMLIRVIEKHSDKDAVEHGYCWHNQFADHRVNDR